MEYLDLEKQEFFTAARQWVMTAQLTLHRHLETFLIIQLQFTFTSWQNTKPPPENFKVIMFKIKYYKSSLWATT